jgi:hypothetical protein
MVPLSGGSNLAPDGLFNIYLAGEVIWIGGEKAHSAILFACIQAYTLSPVFLSDRAQCATQRDGMGILEYQPWMPFFF